MDVFPLETRERFILTKVDYEVVVLSVSSVHAYDVSVNLCCDAM